MDSNCYHPQVAKNLSPTRSHQRSTIYPSLLTSIIYLLLSRFARGKIDPSRENPTECCIGESLQNSVHCILYMVLPHERMFFVQNIQYLEALYKTPWFFQHLRNEILQTINKAIKHFYTQNAYVIYARYRNLNM